MANYAETTKAVTTWLRAKRVTMLNPYAGEAEVQFDEERATSIDGGPAKFEPTGTLKRAFDPARVIPLIDPATGEDTGQTTTEGAIYAALFSAYWQMAQARDAS